MLPAFCICWYLPALYQRPTPLTTRDLRVNMLKLRAGRKFTLFALDQRGAVPNEEKGDGRTTFTALPFLGR